MKYTLIVATDPEKVPALGTPAQEEMAAAFFAFNEKIVAEGAYLAGEPLDGVETATTLRNVNGSVSATDGPFAETKEQIGGVYLVECADLDAALALARMIPTVALGYGSVEVRPCCDYSALME